MDWITIGSSTAGLIMVYLYNKQRKEMLKQIRKIVLDYERKIMVLELYLDTLERKRGIKDSVL